VLFAVLFSLIMLIVALVMPRRSSKPPDVPWPTSTM